MKELLKNVRTRVWFIVTVVMTALMIVVSVLSSTIFYDTVCLVLGNPRTVGRDKGFYYEVEADSKAETFERGNKINETICEEGFVLLKNQNDALPLAGHSKISVFGKNSVNPVYGGSGSGGGNFRGAVGLYDSLEAAGFSVNPVLKAFYGDDKKSGAGRAANPAIEDNSNATLATGETPYGSYDEQVRASYAEYSDAAIIIFSRIGGEGNDLPRVQEGNPEKHYLELDANEERLLKEVTGGVFGKVIVLLNASTTMEIGSIANNKRVDACLSVGGPGYSGFSALGRILSGEVTPSGRTVDTWAADFTENPVYVNFSNNGVAADKSSGRPDGAAYTSGGKSTGYYFVDYEEGIYVGYRYYETRGAQDAGWYEKQVVYPFGYGLSYTGFEWEVLEAEKYIGYSLTDSVRNEEIEIKVKVTNTGKYKGKDVVSLYCDAPAGDIEKSSTVLVGFEKTPLLYPSAENAVERDDAANGKDRPNSAVITLVFNPYYAASYDYSDANGNGFSGYELESGDYALRLKTDAHTEKSAVAPIIFSVGENILYETDPVTGKEVRNRFDDADDELDTVLSRSDWEKTRPTASDTRELSAETKSGLTSYDSNNPENDYKMPVTGAEKTMNAIQLRGAAYGDEKWERFLDQLTFTELKDLFNRGAFKTSGIMRLNLPETVASDGPVGFVNFISEANVSGNAAYASQYVLGCTWSKDLARAMGESVGEEGIYGDGGNIPVPYTGWYAPGMNLHRSPFGGRNSEYFSEDPYLTGVLAAAEIGGAQSKGVIPYMKHFALNEQETHRDDNGVATWATEQAIRELYLRPFEIAVKTAGAKGVMSSFNRIGTEWTGGDYRLLTEVLRGEWGFEGSVICDFNVSSYMSPKQMIYAGGDLNLTTMRYWMKPDENTASDVCMLRRAAHNVLYCVVNSNAMNGIGEHTVLRLAMPVWQEVTFITEGAIFAALAVWGFFEIRAARKRFRGDGRVKGGRMTDTYGDGGA